jgi:uncharacterized 2Fe-2S/4Fe-4S cluster protein (DUF4445 family)
MKKLIHFNRFNKSEVLEAGKSILDYARDLDIPINSGCGGLGICKECLVKIEKGLEGLNERTDSEKGLKENERLACQAIVENSDYDIYVRVVRAGLIENILSTGKKRKEILLDPLVKRKKNCVFSGDKKIDNYRGGIFGISADIGTTTVVLHLLDLEKGNIVYTSAFENPQRRIGGDNIISRIQFDIENSGKLTDLLISKINEEIRKMPVETQKIYDFVVVGNSTMRDLFFGLDVQSLGMSPFKSVTETENGSIYLKVKTIELNLNANKNAQIYSPPIIGSHVGADALAVGLSCGVFDDTKENIMCVDIGTNGEVILKARGKLFATSCAAGSALEPMPAVPGAIYWFSIDGKKNKWKTIGNSKPVGVCGSGMIDILGELIKNNMMDKKGYLKDRKAFKIADNIKLAQSDIKGEKGLLWSKAAVSLGIKALIEEANLNIAELDKVYLAGSFGNYIDKKKARTVGLIPDVPFEKIVQAGNAAALGANEMLLSMEMRKLAENTANKIRHIRLEFLPDYGERLMLVEQQFERLR